MMRDIAPEDRVAEAVRLADELIGGLASPKVPNQASVAAPSPQVLADWEGHLARKDRTTVPDVGKAAVHFRRAGDALQRATIPPGPGRYSGPVDDGGSQ